MDKERLIRLVYAPFSTILFVLSWIPTLRTKPSIPWFVPAMNEWEKGVLGLVLGGVAVTALGFLVSVVTFSYFRLCWQKWEIELSKNAQIRLRQVINSAGLNENTEQNTWRLKLPEPRQASCLPQQEQMNLLIQATVFDKGLLKRESPELSEWMKRRWTAVLISSNYFFGVLLAFVACNLLTLILAKAPNAPALNLIWFSLWFLLTLVAMFCLALNAQFVRFEAFQMYELLLTGECQPRAFWRVATPTFFGLGKARQNTSQDKHKD